MENSEVTIMTMRQICEMLKTEVQKSGLKWGSVGLMIQDFERRGVDQQLFRVFFKHIKTVTDIAPKLKREDDLTDVKTISLEEYIDFHISNFFVQNIHHYDYKSPCPFQEDFNELIESVPIEAFLKPDYALKEKLEKEIQKLEIFCVEVLDLNYADKTGNLIKVRFICKCDERNTILYHLNMIGYMFRDHELKRLGAAELKVSDILKVTALNSFVLVKHERRIYLTSNSTLCKNRGDFQLGRISVNDLPFNFKLFKEAQKFPNYTQYLRSKAEFNLTSQLKNLIQSVGVNINKSYSFRNDNSASLYEDDTDILAMKNKAELELHFESKKHLEQACKYSERGDVKIALALFDEALKCWPKNHKVFEKRGVCYLKNKKTLSAIKDFENALALNPSAQEAKVNYSEILVQMAIKERKKNKNLRVSKDLATRALQLNKDNLQAKKLLEKIEKESKLSNLEIQALEKKKEELQFILKTENCD